MNDVNYGEFLEGCKGFSLGVFEDKEDDDDTSERLSEGELLAISLKRQRDRIDFNAEKDEKIWNDAVGSTERRALLSSVKHNLDILTTDNRIHSILNQCVIQTCGSSSASAKQTEDESPEIAEKQLISDVRMCVDQLASLASQESNSRDQSSPTDTLDAILHTPVSSLQ